MNLRDRKEFDAIPHTVNLLFWKNQGKIGEELAGLVKDSISVKNLTC